MRPDAEPGPPRPFASALASAEYPVRLPMALGNPWLGSRGALLLRLQRGLQARQMPIALEAAQTRFDGQQRTGDPTMFLIRCAPAIHLVGQLPDLRQEVWKRVRTKFPAAARAAKGKSTFDLTLALARDSHQHIERMLADDKATGRSNVAAAKRSIISSRFFAAAGGFAPAAVFTDGPSAPAHCSLLTAHCSLNFNL